MCVYNVRPLTLTRIPENPKKKNGEANYLYFHPRGVNRVSTTTIAQRPLDGVWSVERNRHRRRGRDCCRCYIRPIQF